MPEIEGDLYDPETQGNVVHSERLKREEDMAKARATLEVRQGAFRRVFKQGQPSRDDRDIVNADIKSFCRGNETTFHENERIQLLLTGRQEVYLRIDDFLNMSVDQLVEKYTQRKEA